MTTTLFAATTGGAARTTAAALDGDESALRGLARVRAADRHDRFAALLQLYRLHTAPVAELGDAARLAGHPAVAAAKWRLEDEWLRELATDPVPGDVPHDDAVTALRRIAARDRLPGAYRWLADDADHRGLVAFLTLEGGPDADFDDLVAACQVGLDGRPKLELAGNYWDEMGNGELRDVHTELYRALVRALGLTAVPLEEQPVSALERSALGGLLATNHWLQPEMIGALGLVELQAGPRCRLVLQAFDRLGVPDDAYDFYRVHAEVDPRHGRDWVDHAVVPLVEAHPDWGPRIVRGAWWRSQVNARFFDDVERLMGATARAA